MWQRSGIDSRMMHFWRAPERLKLFFVVNANSPRSTCLHISTNIYFMDARNGSSFLDRVKDTGAIESLRALLVRSIGNRILFSAPCSVDESQPCEFAVWPASGYNPIPPVINPGVMPYRALLASALLLAACTTTQGVTDRLGERYTGRHIDQFFLSYGSPISEYALSNGDKFYTWRSDVNSVTLPGSSNFSGSVNNYGQIQSSSIHRPPITIPIICEIRLFGAFLRHGQTYRDHAGHP